MARRSDSRSSTNGPGARGPRFLRRVHRRPRRMGGEKATLHPVHAATPDRPAERLARRQDQGHRPAISRPSARQGARRSARVPASRRPGGHRGSGRRTTGHDPRILPWRMPKTVSRRVVVSANWTRWSSTLAARASAAYRCLSRCAAPPPPSARRSKTRRPWPNCSTGSAGDRPTPHQQPGRQQPSQQQPSQQQPSY